MSAERSRYVEICLDPVLASDASAANDMNEFASPGLLLAKIHSTLADVMCILKQPDLLRPADHGLNSEQERF